MEDWLARWREGRICFHQTRPHALLERHVAQLDGRRRVLVPLCGKSEDLAFLAARGHDVIGIELAEQAVSAFFVEHGLAPTVAPHGPFAAWTADAAPGSPAGLVAEDAGDPASAAGRREAAHAAGSFTLLVGDFFAATSALIGPIDALYDRAALIALPPELRPRYAAVLRSLVPPSAPAIVITLEYDQRAMSGPPFAVLEPELRALYAGADVEPLAQRPFPDDGGKCAQSGVPATERCFLIRSHNARS